MALLSLAVLLAMAPWFSASAVLPQLTGVWRLNAGGEAWMTIGVQLGFVLGALASAVLNVPDRVPTPKLFAVSALAAAAANAAVAAAPGPTAAVALRLATGAALAGVYPPGMKLMASWCLTDRGLGIGLVVGALTLGSAVPHLLNALAPGGTAGMPPWRDVLLATSGLAAVAGVLAATTLRTGPYVGRSAPFDWRLAGRILAERPTRLVNVGYLGHMWELYAMWAWVPLVLLDSYQAADLSPRAARWAAFAVIGSGAFGCLAAGLLADRVGRTMVTVASLATSGACAGLAGLLLDRPGWLTALCVVWGVAVIADSAQFSAAASELADARYVGTALALQTSLGFLLTLATIRLVPAARDGAGWDVALALLAVGPAVGALAMLRLRRLPEALRLAGGRR